MKKEFKVIKKYQDSRIDKFLVAKTGLSRNKIQQMIKSGQIKMNDELPKVHQFLKFNDKIVILEKEKVIKSLTKKIKTKDHKIKFKPNIIFKCKDYFILTKPAGMLVHPTLKQETNTLADWLIKKYPKLKKIGEDPVRPAIVHRLDKEVSGLMIIPRTQDAFDYFKSQFKLRKIKKEYIALVHGVIEKYEGEINFPIARSKTGKFVAWPKGSDQGKSAITEFEVIKRFQKFTLLKIKPITGRTNQIRVHLNAIDHAIVGDPLYFSKDQKSKKSINQIFLYAAKLTFIDLQGEEQTYESQLPVELQNFLANL